jgi:hypothetical protein
MADSGTVSQTRTFYDWLLDRWPDRDTVRSVLDAVHRLELAREAERTALAPVVNVTLPGVPGHFTGTAGAGDAAYVPESLS